MTFQEIDFAAWDAPGRIAIMGCVAGLIIMLAGFALGRLRLGFIVMALVVIPSLAVPAWSLNQASLATCPLAQDNVRLKYGVDLSCGGSLAHPAGIHLVSVVDEAGQTNEALLSFDRETSEPLLSPR